MPSKNSKPMIKPALYKTIIIIKNKVSRMTRRIGHSGQLDAQRVIITRKSRLVDPRTLSDN